MQWLIAAAVGFPILLLLPFFISRMKNVARRKRSSGVGQSFEAAFAVFDPARARAVQAIEMRKEVGHADEGDQGDLLKDAI